uniref:Uncharacterized protein n=1 Tax=Timema poppense TaxID=170557 RepID=A0A7R9DFV5_TIMPO|nr:unnamed protein product [Timema poppensis]
MSHFLQRTEIHYLRQLLEKCDICSAKHIPKFVSSCPPAAVNQTQAVTPTCVWFSTVRPGLAVFISGEITRESCQSNPPPCFQGVACQDTREGVRCGHCPRGYVGDGRTCTPGTTCEEKPCFPGRSLLPTPNILSMAKVSLQLAV